MFRGCPREPRPNEWGRHCRRCSAAESLHIRLDLLRLPQHPLFTAGHWYVVSLF